MKQKPIRDFLVAALKLAERGWPVFPCNPENKKPLTLHGFKDATKDPEQIMRWWKEFPTAMIGVPMGPASGVFCIDLDRKPGGDDGVETWDKLESEHGTVTTKTHDTPSTGRHKFFQHQAGIRNIPLGRLAPGLEVKADGGYVIVPPSKMMDGKKYTVIADVETAPAPPWLLKMIRDYYDLDKQMDKDGQTTERASPGPHEPPDIDKIKFVLLHVIPSDDYDKWYHVAGAVRRELGESGLSLFEAWSAKSTKYKLEECHKKWEDAKVLTQITGKSLYYYADEADLTWRERYEQWQASGTSSTQSTTTIKQKTLADVLKDAATLQSQTFEPLHFIVQKYLLEGLFLLGGKPKVGKSWLALDIAVAVSSDNGTCMGEECEHGAVLALMLEDTDRRIQRRLTKMLGAQKEAWPKRLKYATSWPRLDVGGIAWIQEWLGTAENPRLIIIDILERVLPRLSNKEKRSQYSTDYYALAMLQELTKAHPGLCIVVLHHQRKADADDLIDTISGTLGLGGAVDAILILGTDKVSRDKYLYGRGRDLEEFNVTIKQDEHARWQVLGQRIEGEAVSPERAKIIATLTRVAPKAMNIKEVADAIDGKYVNVKNLLTKLYAEGLIERIATGLYRMPKPQNEMKFDDTNIPY